METLIYPYKQRKYATLSIYTFQLCIRVCLCVDRCTWIGVPEEGRGSSFPHGWSYRALLAVARNGYREPNPDLLQEQCVLLTQAFSPVPQIYV